MMNNRFQPLEDQKTEVFLKIVVECFRFFHDRVAFPFRRRCHSNIADDSRCFSECFGFGHSQGEHFMTSQENHLVADISKYVTNFVS